MTAHIAHPGRRFRLATIELLVATTRTMSWAPLLLCTLVSSVVTIAARMRVDATPALVAGAVAAAIAAAGCVALGDPARVLLEPVPTSPLVRLARRVALAGLGIAVALAIISLGASLSGAVASTAAASGAVLSGTVLSGTVLSGTVLSGAVALFAAGVGVHALVARRSEHAGEIGALVSFGWFVSGSVLPDRFIPELATVAWRDQPWAVTCIAALITLMYRRERRWRPRGERAMIFEITGPFRR